MENKNLTLSEKLKLAQQDQAIDKPRKIGLPKFHQKLQQAETQQATIDAQATMMENRIALMLDTSGSMAMTDNSASGSNYNRFHQKLDKSKIELLREAMQSFVSQCNFGDTSLALETFPFEEEFRLGLTSFEPILTTTVMSLQAGGGTPLSQAMSYVLGSYSLTRGIIVSDGDADNGPSALDIAGQYAEAGVPLDCVHIGTSSGGEQLLKDIAERTGGIFIKFDNVNNFAKNFSYLTPAKRSQLFLSGAAGLLGAKEIK